MPKKGHGAGAGADSGLTVSGLLRSGAVLVALWAAKQALDRTSLRTMSRHILTFAVTATASLRIQTERQAARAKIAAAAAAAAKSAPAPAVAATAAAGKPKRKAAANHSDAPRGGASAAAGSETQADAEVRGRRVEAAEAGVHAMQRAGAGAADPRRVPRQGGRPPRPQQARPSVRESAPFGLDTRQIMADVERRSASLRPSLQAAEQYAKAAADLAVAAASQAGARATEALVAAERAVQAAPSTPSRRAPHDAGGRSPVAGAADGVPVAMTVGASAPEATIESAPASSADAATGTSVATATPADSAPVDIPVDATAPGTTTEPASASSGDASARPLVGAAATQAGAAAAAGEEAPEPDTTELEPTSSSDVAGRPPVVGAGADSTGADGDAASPEAGDGSGDHHSSSTETGSAGASAARATPTRPAAEAPARTNNSAESDAGSADSHLAGLHIRADGDHGSVTGSGILAPVPMLGSRVPSTPGGYTGSVAGSVLSHSAALAASQFGSTSSLTRLLSDLEGLVREFERMHGAVPFSLEYVTKILKGDSDDEERKAACVSGAGSGSSTDDKETKKKHIDRYVLARHLLVQYLMQMDKCLSQWLNMSTEKYQSKKAAGVSFQLDDILRQDSLYLWTQNLVLTLLSKYPNSLHKRFTEWRQGKEGPKYSDGHLFDGIKPETGWASSVEAATAAVMNEHVDNGWVERKTGRILPAGLPSVTTLNQDYFKAALAVRSVSKPKGMLSGIFGSGEEVDQQLALAKLRMSVMRASLRSVIRVIHEQTSSLIEVNGIDAMSLDAESKTILKDAHGSRVKEIKEWNEGLSSLGEVVPSARSLNDTTLAAHHAAHGDDAADPRHTNGLFGGASADSGRSATPRVATPGGTSGFVPAPSGPAAGAGTA